MVSKSTIDYRYFGVLTILELYTSYSYSFQLKYNTKSNIILNIISTFVKIIIINNYEQKKIMVLNLKSNSIRENYPILGKGNYLTGYKNTGNTNLLFICYIMSVRRTQHVVFGVP